MKRLLIVISMILPFTNFNADKITLVADPWLPYVGIEKSSKQGYMVEVAIEAFKEAGHTVRYINRPWARAISGTRSNKFTGLISTYKTDAPDFIFPKETMGKSTSAFFVLEGSKWTFTNIESLKNKVLGVVKGYSYGKILDNYVTENANNRGLVEFSYGEQGLESLLKKLKAKRIDCFASNIAVLNKFLQNNKNYSYVKEAGTISTSDVYLAFSPKHPKALEYAKALDIGIKKMRKDGRLKQILTRYGLKDWK